MGWGRTLVGVTCCVLVLGAPGVASAGETGAPPPAGSTFHGTAPNVTVDLTALAPDSDGGILVRGTVKVACPEKKQQRLPAEVEDTVSGQVDSDGKFAIDAQIAGPAEGIQSYGRVRLRGTFTDTGASATIRYDLIEEDDTDEVIDDCNVGPVPVDFVTGPVDAGVARVQAAIPVIKDSNPHYQGVTATTATHVFVAIRKSEFDLDRRTTVLLRVDPATNEIEERRTVAQDLWGLAVVGDQLFGIDVPKGNVVPVDTETLATRTPVNLAPGTRPGDLSYDTAPLWPRAAAVDGALWVSASRDSEVVRFDPTTGSVTGRVPIERHPTDLAAGPDGVYAATNGAIQNGRADDAAVRIDPATNTVAATSAPSANLGTVVADATQVVMSDNSPDGNGLAQLDPSTLTTTVVRQGKHPTLFIAAPPGIWGISYPSQELVALDATLANAATVVTIEPGDNEMQASAGFGAIWVYDQGLRLVYRIATG